VGYSPGAASASAAGGSSRAKLSANASGGSAVTALKASAVDVVNTTANTTTSAKFNNVLAAVKGDVQFTQPLEFNLDLIEQDLKAGTKKVRLTSDGGSVAMKPNKDATVSATFPANVSVTGVTTWDGVLHPPIVRDKAVIAEGGNLNADDVATVIHVGSLGSTLNFSEPVNVTVPVNLVDDVTVEVHFSADGVAWEKLPVGALTVSDGSVTFATEHFTYFAVVLTEESVAMAEEIIEEKGGSMTAEAAQVTIPFVDMASHWSMDYVTTLYNLDIISGKTSTIFAPNDSITRAELAKMAVLAFGYDVPAGVSSKPFKDVDTNAWYAPYLEVAKANGILQGYSSGHARPNTPVNRAEALKILMEAGNISASGGATSFKDVSGSAWYFKYVAWASSNGIVEGYANNTFRPGNNITRAEAAKIIVELMGHNAG
jgi:hypothetical protein